MRTIYLGTSDFAAAVLRRLASSVHAPALVVTRPDRPRGRGRRLAPPPVAETAGELGLEVFQPESINTPEAWERMAAAGAEIGCVCAFGALIKEPLLAELELLNVHPSLLPRWRGAAPVERAIMAGDTRTGVSIMRVTAGLDSGPVCLQEPEDIRPDDDYGSLATRLNVLGGELLVKALDAWAGGLECHEQPEEGVTYAEKIGPEDRILDPQRTAAELELQVRALNPHVGARFGDLGVRAAAAVPGGPPAGELAAEGAHLYLGTAAGALELLEVQPPGGRPMGVAAYLRGHPV